MSFEPSPIADASARPNGDRWTLVFVRDLRHSPAKVWAALTDPAQLGKWAPYTASRDLASTGEATLTMIDGATHEDLAATVTHVEPLKLLEYSWGGDLLRWELSPTADGTQLTLLHTMTDKDWIAKVAAGWHLCLDVADRLLEGNPIEPIRGDDAKNYGWEELAAAYEEKVRRSM
jgi:uncharacterized protein YndB with AHSA1/START domain